MKQYIKKMIITAGVIIIEDNKILLVKRPNDSRIFPNSRTFPGGKLENGETLSECAKRECFEEAGILPINLCQHSFYEYEGDTFKVISHLFKCDNEQEINENDVIKFFSLNDLENISIAFGYKDIMIKELQKI